MKTIRKVNILIACVAMLLITACNNEEVLRDPSPIKNPNSTNVFFAANNNIAPVLGISQDTFKVVISREKSDKAQVVALTFENVYGSIFTAPSTVSFAAGQDTTFVNIITKGMELMKKYHIALKIDQDQTNPYDTTLTKALPRIELSVMKEDFAPYAEGTYTSDFFSSATFSGVWTQILEYSQALKLYRLKNLWYIAGANDGYNVTFKWDGPQSAVVNMVGTAYTNSKGSFITLETGNVDATYGMISAYYYTSKSLNYYNASTQTFTFPVRWYVSAGSFGDDPEIFAITKFF